MMEKELFSYVLRLGDNSLIMGQRLAEWCGQAPVLEQDIALTNIALDHIGQARSLLTYAGVIEGNNRSEDDLAFFRNAFEFRNNLLVELPNVDFGFTIAKQFFFDVYQLYLCQELLTSKNEFLAGFAEKTLKEVKYHVRHSREWMLRLGDGTEESHNRMQNALNTLWEYTGEFFEKDESDVLLINAGIIPSPDLLKIKWDKDVLAVLEEATLSIPDTNGYMATGSRLGRHTEHLDYILAEMQVLPRSMPDAVW